VTCKAVISLSRRDDMTADQFRRWWLDEHAPLAAQLPGLRRIVFNVADQTDDVDGISELWFDSREAFDAAYASDLGRAVAADSMTHVRSRTRLFVAEHVVIDDNA
jgi:uncharacterized protein (TIGR02118 family)